MWPVLNPAGPQKVRYHKLRHNSADQLDEGKTERSLPRARVRRYLWAPGWSELPYLLPYIFTIIEQASDFTTFTSHPWNQVHT
jgi:hypothetical protein